MRFGTETTTGTATGFGFTIIGGMVDFGPGVDWRKPRTPERLAAIEKARKVRALARRPGTPEEGEAAARMLAKIMVEHGIHASELDAPLTQIVITVRRRA